MNVYNTIHVYACTTKRIGVYTGDSEPADQHLFVCEHKTLRDLCQGLMEPCMCVGYSAWRLESISQVQ